MIMENEPSPRPVLLQPEYASPRAYKEPPRAPIHLATFCGLTPLILGLVIFVCWSFTRNFAWKEFGFLDIVFGLGCTVLGVSALVLQFYRTSGTGLGHFRRFVSSSWIALLLLAINFPVCWLVLQGVDAIQTKYPVPSQNMSD
jgi:hypothetical protein